MIVVVTGIFVVHVFAIDVAIVISAVFNAIVVGFVVIVFGKPVFLLKEV